MVCCVKLDNRGSEITQLEVIVHFRYHSKVSKHITKRKKPEIQVKDIQKAAETVMKNKKLR
jgi:hypothetical protein